MDAELQRLAVAVERLNLTFVRLADAMLAPDGSADYCARCDHVKASHPEGLCEAPLCGCWDYAELPDDPDRPPEFCSCGHPHGRGQDGEDEGCMRGDCRCSGWTPPERMEDARRVDGEPPQYVPALPADPAGRCYRTGCDHRRDDHGPDGGCAFRNDALSPCGCTEYLEDHPF